MKNLKIVCISVLLVGFIIEFSFANVSYGRDFLGEVEEPVCGDNIVGPPELCDGDNLKEKTCEDLGFDGGVLSCSDNCLSFDISGCFIAKCGNGAIDFGEECDGFDLDGETCEGLGFDNGILACKEDCTYDTSDCFTPSLCGNGVIDLYEECDGSELGGATCEELGYDGGSLSCYDDCIVNRADCFITQSRDARVMFGHDAEDRSGIYINSYRINQCGHYESYGECVCDPACAWDDDGCFDINAGTLRLFGEGSLDAAFPYDDPSGPIDPTSDEAPEKDFLTFNPAIMPDAGPGSTDFYREALMINGNNANEKVFLRQWYVPAYREPRGNVWTDQSPEFSRDIVKEYTFMLLDPYNEPYPGSGGSTSFIFPAAYSNADQIGLDGWDVNNDGEDDPTLLNGVDPNYIDIGTGQFRLQAHYEEGDLPTSIEFLDHRAEITFVGSSVSDSWVMVRIYYPSAYGDEDPIGASEFVMEIGDTLVAGRHEVSVGPNVEPTPVFKPWYLKLVAVDITTEPFTCIVQVGRLLQERETFFSDGAEYDIAKIHTLGDELLYITLRNPLPKDRDVHLASLTVWKEQIGLAEPFPMLPPFNKVHAVIDDIDGSLNSCDFPIVTDVCPVVERWVRQSTEPRFTTKLCEILDGLGWSSLDVKTLPDFYVDLILPEQEDAPGRPGDYLLTSSFMAPNSDYARVSFHYDAASTEGLTDIYVNDDILRVYGEDTRDAAFPYDDPSGPIDPLSDEAPEKDFLTFNPAILPDAGPGSTQFYREALMVNGNNANEKVFLRQWYVPEYKEPRGDVWTDQSPVYTPDIIKEYTYMLLDPYNDPYPGSAGSTSFIFPAAFTNQNQVGLDGWDVDGDGEDDPTLLHEVGPNYIDIGTGLHRLQGRDTVPDNFSTDIEFLDHRAEIEFIGSSVSTSWIEVTIYYASAFDAEDQIGASQFIMTPGDRLIAGRHVVELDDEPEPIMMPWYLDLVAVDIFTEPYTAIVKVGRLLQEGETFFSDGAEYDVAKLHTPGDQLLYITLRNPLPKGYGEVALSSLTVWKERIPHSVPLPMLPPFNKTHAVIDDVGGNNLGCTFPIITDVIPVAESWIEETTEPRFATRLCEIYDGSGWRDQLFETMPSAYTAFDLPTQRDAVVPGDYLLTSSWVLQEEDDTNGGVTVPPQTYCISGNTSDAQNRSIAGVTVTAGGRSDSTGADGSYEICGLRSGVYIVSPNREGYTFAPENAEERITYADVENINFVGRVSHGSGSGLFTISGQVTEHNTLSPVEGVTIEVAKQGGGTVATAQSGFDGSYVVNDVPGGESYRVISSKNDCTFVPVHTDIDDLSSDQTNISFAGECSGGSGTGEARINIYPSYLIRARWLILPGFLTIRGTNISFDARTRIVFEPKNAVVQLFKRVIDEENIVCLVFVMPSWFASAYTQQVALKVTAGPEEAESALDITMLSTLFTGE